MPQAYGFSEYGDKTKQLAFEQPEPTPGPSEITVAVHAAGVNPVDWKIREGYMASMMTFDMPGVLGREVSGTVTAVGKDVDGFAVGDEVFGAVAPTHGGYAEVTVLSAATAAKKPVQLGWSQAATLPVAGATAYDAIMQLGLKEGQTLLVTGIGGGVGVVAAQLARDAGVAVVGTASETKRELVESLGAILVPSGEGVADRVREIFPQGVDAVLDCVGGEPLREVVPLAPGPHRVLSLGDYALTAELGLAQQERAETATTLAAIARLVVAGKVDPFVEQELPLAQAGEALAAVETGHARGKVVITVR